MRTLFFLFFSTVFTFYAYGQDLEWNVNMHGFADNQEFTKEGLPAPTIFGTRFSPELGFRIDSIHRVRLGFNSLHEFGDKHHFARKINPVIYYNYQNNGISFYFGAFPRYQLLQNYPRALLKDPILYFRPNIEGFLFSYSNRKVEQKVWIDWTSKQTDQDREGFVVGHSGTFMYKQFYFSHFFTLWHNALPAVQNSNDHIQDNAAFMAKVGVDLSEGTFLGSLDLNIGGLMSFDRLRNVYDWRSPKGIVASIYLDYRSFFLYNEFYIGEEQFIGHGDPFYDSKRYDRLDIGWNAFKTRHLDASISLSLHFTPQAMSNQQMINLRYNLGGNVPLRRP